MDQEGINIMISSETNMKRTDIKQMVKHQSRYQAFATKEPSKGKKKGFSIVILMDSSIGKYIYKRLECDAYGLALKLSFKGKHIINIIGLYYPPDMADNKTERATVSKWLSRLLKDATYKGERTFVGEDFNSIANDLIDRDPPSNWRIYRRIHKIMDMFDTYRTMKEGKSEFTYEYLVQDTDDITRSRLDYIYTDQETTSYNLTGVAIKDTRELLNTDHKMTYALFNVTE